MPSLIKTMQLLDFSGKQVYPPPRTPLAVLVTQGMPAPLAHPGAKWWQEREEREAARQAEAEQVARYYEEQARAKEAHEKATR